MPVTARVAVARLNEPRLRVEEVRLPDPGPDQVIVKEFFSGICHSQLHEIHGTTGPRTDHILLGHEATGTVVAAGKDVRHVKEGDNVWVTFINRNPSFAGEPTKRWSLALPDGQQAWSYDVFTWADHTIAQQRFVVPMPPSARKDVTAIIGCAVPTGFGSVYYTAGVRAGQSVAVFGAGGVGLSAIAGARIVGASPIIAVDLREEKLALAKKMGATVAINASVEDPVARIRELTRRDDRFDINGDPVAGVDFAFDCIGAAATMRQILPAVRPSVLGAPTGGTAVLVGIPVGKTDLDTNDLMMNEKKYIGSMAGSCQPERDFPALLRWFEAGALDLDTLVTRRFKLDQINEAFEALQAGEILGRSIIEF